MVAEVFSLYAARGGFFLGLLLEHIRICACAVLIAGAAGLVLGILISEYAALSVPVIGATNIIYTIPSIALLGLLIPFTGIGDTTAIIALTVYALLPMVRNTYAGLSAVDAQVIEAARGMGSTQMQLLIKIKLPLASAVIVAGLRNMVVMTVAMAGIASFIGAGGLGVAIYRGITTNNMAMTFAASILTALLAFTCDFILGRVEKHIYRKRRIPICKSKK